MASSSDGGGNSWKQVKRGTHHRSPHHSSHHQHQQRQNQRHQHLPKVASYSPEVQDEVKKLFEKKFDFVKPEVDGDQVDEAWSLPPAEKLFAAEGVQVK